MIDLYFGQGNLNFLNFYFIFSEHFIGSTQAEKIESETKFRNLDYQLTREVPMVLLITDFNKPDKKYRFPVKSLKIFENLVYHRKWFRRPNMILINDLASVQPF